MLYHIYIYILCLVFISILYPFSHNVTGCLPVFLVVFSGAACSRVAAAAAAERSESQGDAGTAR